ncbi:MAG: zinc dependent phospholipase C family protein [Lachnospiraceae bacterium]|nr:zinc dependent phospholipase C family protein [Lachnospiraceae bacterium]
METKNHFHLAKFIGTKQNLSKHTNALIFGSIMPDFNLPSHLRGHTYKDSIHLIQDKASSLVKHPIWNNDSYYDLGVILHYVADYFTFPHNENFHGSFSQHLRYERCLHNHFVQFLKKQQNINAGILSSCSLKFNSLWDLFDILKEKHHEYCLTKPSFNKDCNYIFSLTSLMAYGLPQLRKQFR